MAQVYCLDGLQNLSDEKQGELDFLLMMYPRLGEAKIMFNEIWDFTDSEEAMVYLTFLCDMVNDTDIFSLERFVKTVQAHWSGILNYIKTRISGILEGNDNKIQLAKRRARGYRNMSNFKNMIYFIVGKMKFNYPHYSL